MAAKIEMKEGDDAKILIGQHWHECRVVKVGDVPHYSGNRETVYQVEFPNGDTLTCGRNSLKARHAKG